MATSKHILSRRQALAGIALAGAATSSATVAAGTAFVPRAGRAAWDAAVARLNAAERAYERVAAIYERTYEAAEAACPRRDEFSTRYKVSHGQSRESNHWAARSSLVMERMKDRYLTADEARQATDDAWRIVDDFEAYSARRAEAYRDHSKAEAEHDVAAWDRSKARDALFATPAPDNAAMLFKIELLSNMMCEAEVEDADRLKAICTDARRLLTSGRA